MDWTLPPNLSANAGAVDDLYHLILIITGIALVIVEAGILWFVVRYRDRPGRQAAYVHGDDRLEIAWTAVTALVVVFLGFYSGQVWAELKAPGSVPEDAYVVDVSVKQFEWMFTYPGADGELGTGDDFTERNHLHVPAERPVEIRLRSEDVIHSFFIPALRVKQDAVPGMTTSTWFVASEPASLELACAELCGLGHYRMQAEVTVQAPTDFEAWHAERAAEATGES